MNTIKCPKCDSENLSTNIRCSNCGEQLITEDQIQNLNSSFDVQEEIVQAASIESFVGMFSGMGTIVGGIMFIGISVIFMLSFPDVTTKVIGTLFLFFGLVAVVNGVLMVIRGINNKKNTNDYINGKLDMNKVKKSEKDYEKRTNFINNLYTYVFLLFCFGFLIVNDIQAFKTSFELFFSLTFLVFLLIALLIKLKKNK